MEIQAGWTVAALATLAALGAVAAGLLVRSRRRIPDLSEEEKAELAGTPMPALQKAAWWSLAVGLITLGACAALVGTYGPVAYWNDDGLRLTVMLIFVAGLLVQLGVLTGPASLGALGRRLDERDRAVLGRSTMAQSAFVMLTLAAWMIALTERFREEGAVPVVYLYLIFGSVVLVLGVGQAVGVLLGYGMGGADGQG